MPNMSPSPSRGRTRLIAATTILLHLVTNITANCFLPNGTDRNSILWDSHGVDYRPSGFGSPLDNYQMCCATNNRINPDTPRKDGLCQESGNSDAIWRESCTDPTWKSPSCVKLCIDGIDDAGDNRRDHDIKITQCPDLSYCCGASNTTCCNQGHGVWLKDGEPTTINPNSAQSTTTSAILAGATSPVLIRPASIPRPIPQSTALSGTTIAGVAVGAVAAVVFLALGIWLFLLRRRRRRQSIDASTVAPQSSNGDQSPSETKTLFSRFQSQSSTRKDKTLFSRFQSQSSTRKDKKEDLSISIHPLHKDEDGHTASELYGDKGQITPRAELAGEDSGSQKNESPVELVGCMPAYRELE